MTLTLALLLLPLYYLQPSVPLTAQSMLRYDKSSFPRGEILMSVVVLN